MLAQIKPKICYIHSIQIVIVLLIVAMTSSTAIAGFGRVDVHEVTAGAGVNGETSLSVSGSLLVHKPNGDAHVIFSRDLEDTNGEITSRLYSQSISNTNVYGTVELLLEIGPGNRRIRLEVAKYADNGDAIIHYQTYENESTNIEYWTKSYIAGDSEPWKAPQQISVTLNNVDLFMNNIGESFYFTGNSKERDLYQYRPTNNSWELVSESVPYETPYFMGGNNDLYYTYSDQLSKEQRLVVFDVNAKTWTEELITNQDSAGNEFPNASRVLVSPDGNDIYTISYVNDIFSVPQVTRLQLRKYKKSVKEWSANAHTLEIPLDATDIAFLQEIVMLDSTKDNISFLVLIKSLKKWKTLKYNETSGWENEASTILRQEAPVVSTLWDAKGRVIASDNANHASFLFCRNACQQIYAKIYDGAAWSEELFLPEFGHEWQRCGLAPFTLTNILELPQFAINKNGNLIATRGIRTKSIGSTDYNKFSIASLIGDVLSSTSYTDCLRTDSAPNIDTEEDNANSSGTSDQSASSSTDSSSGSLSLFLLYAFVMFLMIRLSNNVRMMRIST